MSKKLILFAVSGLILLNACTYPLFKKEETVLARVGDEYLYEEELKDLIPEGTSPKDSIILVRNFVNNW
ncbi:MAG: peptidyl-prolyl cis-trans isomerase, partial [Bacteroidetes bacterium]